MDLIYSFFIHVILISSVKGNVSDENFHPHSNEGHAVHPEEAPIISENGTRGKLAYNICKTYFSLYIHTLILLVYVIQNKSYNFFEMVFSFIGDAHDGGCDGHHGGVNLVSFRWCEYGTAVEYILVLIVAGLSLIHI